MRDGSVVRGGMMLIRCRCWELDEVTIPGMGLLWIDEVHKWEEAGQWVARSRGHRCRPTFECQYSKEEGEDGIKF